jgi:hypothetical protein
MTDRLNELKIASFNAKGGLGRPEIAGRVADVLLDTDADVIGIPDAYHLDTERSTPTDRRLEISPDYFVRAGYDVFDGEYSEDRPFGDDNWAKYHQMTLVRRDIAVRSVSIALGQRHGVVVDVDLANGPLRVITAYFNEQNEPNRQAQLDDLAPHVEGHEVAFIADVNALDGDVMIAKLLRTRFAKAAFGGLQFGNGVIPRLMDMASGQTVARLNGMGLRDADPTHTPTMPASLPLFQLDQVRVTSGVEATPTHRTTHKDLSDHKLISSTVRLRSKN